MFALLLLSSLPIGPPVNSRLGAIVTAYLRQQHRAACLTAAQPVSVVPPVSLLKPYSLPVATRPLNAPANVTLRLARQEVWGGFGGRGARAWLGCCCFGHAACFMFGWVCKCCLNLSQHKGHCYKLRVVVVEGALLLAAYTRLAPVSDDTKSADVSVSCSPFCVWYACVCACRWCCRYAAAGVEPVPPHQHAA